MSESLSQFKALIFDVYGTLVNWESGILTVLSPLLTNPGQEWSKSDILFAFSTMESDLQVKSPTALYSDILAAVYDELSRRSAQHGQLDTTAPDHAIWPIFPDTPAALARLSALGLKLAVLSNVDRASFAHTRTALERQGGFAFDAVYTAEDVGSYKPDPRNFEYAVAQLRADDPTLEREQILVVAQSLLHDHVPARALGLSSVWIDRPDAVTCIDGNGVPKERAAKEAFTKWRFRDLREFANVVEEARAKPS
ncbi:HAD-like protein [Lactarius sanguifluus]|nr:HAD-like protein [Lactarius sanguifluus]